MVCHDTSPSPTLAPLAEYRFARTEIPQVERNSNLTEVTKLKLQALRAIFGDASHRNMMIH
jgi:hypothetical protein